MSWNNGFMLLAPIIIWNLVFWARLPDEAYGRDERVARRVLVTERGM